MVPYGVESSRYPPASSCAVLARWTDVQAWYHLPRRLGPEEITASHGFLAPKSAALLAHSSNDYGVVALQQIGPLDFRIGSFTSNRIGRSRRSMSAMLRLRPRRHCAANDARGQ
jgi:hypothetical protein